MNRREFLKLSGAGLLALAAIWLGLTRIGTVLAQVPTGGEVPMQVPMTVGEDKIEPAASLHQVYLPLVEK